MNYKEFLYAKVAEEATEVAKAALKINLFGEWSKDPTRPHDEINLKQLELEVNDLIAVLALVNEYYDPDWAGTPSIDILQPHIHSKVKKLKAQYEATQLKGERID